MHLHTPRHRGEALILSLAAGGLGAGGESQQETAKSSSRGNAGDAVYVLQLLQTLPRCGPHYPDG